MLRQPTFTEMHKMLKSHFFHLKQLNKEKSHFSLCVILKFGFMLFPRLRLL